MFEDITPESLTKEILDAAAGELETIEGSFAADMAAPVALELWKGYQSLNALTPIAFVDETSGGYIDLRCADYGIERKPGTRARADMALTGTAGAVIPKGTVFLTVDGLEFELLEAVTLTAGAGTGTVEAVDVGRAYNVGAGELTNMVVTLSALTAWQNAAAAGGTDRESDGDLCARLYVRLRTPATSGNAYHYRQWALEVNGVGDARVFPLWNGPGTVKVLLVDGAREPVTAAVVTAAAAHIEEVRPIGAAVTVESAVGKAITVAAAVTLDGSVTVEAVRTAFVSNLDTYLRGVAFTGAAVLYNRIAFLLLDIGGVVDYTALTVNGGEANVVLGELEVPVLGEVTVA